MTDERRKRAAEIYFKMNVECCPDCDSDNIDAMLAFRAEGVAEERARCAKVCRDLATNQHQVDDAAKYECAEAIEKGEK